MAIVADFMLVWLPAPTVSLQPALAMNAGAVAKFFHNCPDNAFQVTWSPIIYPFPSVTDENSTFLKGEIFSLSLKLVRELMLPLLQIALAGRSYTLLQRFGAIMVKINFLGSVVTCLGRVCYRLTIWLLSEERCKAFCSRNECISGKFVML